MYGKVGFCQISQLKDFVILHVRISDSESSDILPVIPLTNTLMEVARRKGWKVFVHWYKCKFIDLIIYSKGGISRSPAVIVAYLMQYRNCSFEDAFNLVKEKSTKVNINQCNSIQ